MLDNGAMAGFQSRLENHEFVRRHLALNDHLSQTPGTGNDNGIIEAALGIYRESHARGGQVGAHHLLHADRKRNVGISKTLIHAV